MLGIHIHQIADPGFIEKEGKNLLFPFRPRLMIHHAVEQIQSAGGVVMTHPHGAGQISGSLCDVKPLRIAPGEKRLTLFQEFFDFFGFRTVRHEIIVCLEGRQSESVENELSVRVADITDVGGMVAVTAQFLKSVRIRKLVGDWTERQKTVFVKQFEQSLVVACASRVEIDGVESEFFDVFEKAGVVDFRGIAGNRSMTQTDRVPVQEKFSVFDFKRSESEGDFSFVRQFAVTVERADNSRAEARSCRVPLRKPLRFSGENGVFAFRFPAGLIQNGSVLRKQREFQRSETGEIGADFNAECSVDAGSLPDPDILQRFISGIRRQDKISGDSIASVRSDARVDLSGVKKVYPIFLAELQKRVQLTAAILCGSQDARRFAVDVKSDFAVRMAEIEENVLAAPVFRDLHGPFIPEIRIFCGAGTGYFGIVAVGKLPVFRTEDRSRP